jgi:hypothetical protein
MLLRVELGDTKESPRAVGVDDILRILVDHSCTVQRGSLVIDRVAGYRCTDGRIQLRWVAELIAVSTLNHANSGQAAGARLWGNAGIAEGADEVDGTGGEDKAVGGSECAGEREGVGGVVGGMRRNVESAG